MFTTVGCLLRSLPTDIEFDNTTGISFTCDLSDNIAAPWPSSSSVQSLSLCAPGKQWRNSYLGHRNIVRHLFWNRHMIFFTPLSGTLVFLVLTLVFHYWFQKCHYLHCLSHQNLEAQVINLHLLLRQWDSIYCFPFFISKVKLYPLTVGTSRTGIGVLMSLVFFTATISIWELPHLVSRELLTPSYFPPVQARV